MWLTRWCWPGALYVLVAAGLPHVVGVTIVGISIINAYIDLLPMSWKLLHYAARRRVESSRVALVCIADPRPGGNEPGVRCRRSGTI